jgi:hypothetical protein
MRHTGRACIAARLYIGRLADNYFWLRDRNYSQQSGKKAGRH